MHLGDTYYTWEREREVWTRWQSSVDLPVKIQVWFSALITHCSSITQCPSQAWFSASITNCGAIELARRWWRGKWKWEEAERGKWEEGKFSAKSFSRIEMEQRSSNDNNSTCSRCDNALAFRAQNLILFTNMPLSFSFWVLKTAETYFHFPWLSFVFLSHRVMKTMIQNSSNQMLFCGTHMIWMMETENWVISLKTHPIQTSSKSPTTKLFPNFKVDIIRRKWANAPFKKTIRHFAQFSKLIREMYIFWNSIFSKSSYKKKKKNYGAL